MAGSPRLEHTAANQRATKRHLVGVLEIAACRKPAGGSRNRDTKRGEQTMQICCGSFSREIEICGNDHLLGAFALHAIDQFSDLELIGSDAFDW